MATHIQTSTVNRPLFSNITVKLTDHNGNIFSVMSTVIIALKKHNISMSDISKFSNEVLNSNCYNSALNVCFRWVKIT